MTINHKMLRMKFADADHYEVFDLSTVRTAVESAEHARYTIVREEDGIVLCEDLAARSLLLGKLEDGKTYRAIFGSWAPTGEPGVQRFRRC